MRLQLRISLDANLRDGLYYAVRRWREVPLLRFHPEQQSRDVGSPDKNVIKQERHRHRSEADREILYRYSHAPLHDVEAYDDDHCLVDDVERQDGFIRVLENPSRESAPGWGRGGRRLLLGHAMLLEPLPYSPDRDDPEPRATAFERSPEYVGQAIAAARIDPRLPGDHGHPKESRDGNCARHQRYRPTGARRSVESIRGREKITVDKKAEKGESIPAARLAKPKEQLDRDNRNREQ